MARTGKETADGNGAAGVICATATAVPEHVITKEEVKVSMGRVFDLDARRLALMHGVVDNARVEKRRLVFPLEYTVTPRPLSAISVEYQRWAIELGERAAREALNRAGIGAGEVDLLLTASCTGVMIPSLDAHLINSLGFRANVRRLPITELGCAAGAASLARASDYVRAFPGATALVVAVEIPSLTFQRGDNSAAHLISCVLFGDGAAAAVVSGNGARGARIVDTDSFLFPDSTGAMGFELRDTGFHIVLSKDVPQLIRSRIGGLVDGLLERNGLRREDLGFFLLHPGGQKLLSFIEDELGLEEGDTAASWRVLAEYGNLSSATVLFVMHEWLKDAAPASGEMGLMAAFGPGFSSEMLLLEWK